MKTLYLVVVCLVCPLLILQGQSVDYNKIILPAGAANVSFEERLVQIAWMNNPLSEIVDLGRGAGKAGGEGRHHGMDVNGGSDRKFE